MGARPYKPMYTATATATITTSKSPTANRRFYNQNNSSNGASDVRKSYTNERKKPNPEVKNKRVLPPPESKEEPQCVSEKMKSDVDENIQRF